MPAAAGHARIVIFLFSFDIVNIILIYYYFLSILKIYAKSFIEKKKTTLFLPKYVENRFAM